MVIQPDNYKCPQIQAFYHNKASRHFAMLNNAGIISFQYNIEQFESLNDI